MKTIKNSPKATAGMVISDAAARINSTEETFVQVDDKGITVSGPMSFPSGSSQIRYSALWTMNTEMALTIPSTMATPMPVMIMNPPIKQYKSVMEEAMLMMAMMA
jgi:hypothetical protein